MKSDLLTLILSMIMCTFSVFKCTKLAMKLSENKITLIKKMDKHIILSPLNLNDNQDSHLTNLSNKSIYSNVSTIVKFSKVDRVSFTMKQLTFYFYNNSEQTQTINDRAKAYIKRLFNDDKPDVVILKGIINPILFILLHLSFLYTFNKSSLSIL